MDPDKSEGPSDGKAPVEKRKRAAEHSKGKAPKKGKDSRKWKPGDPLPANPTRRQLIANEKAMMEWYESTLPPVKDSDLDSPTSAERNDPAYRELSRMLAESLPAEEGVPEGAETKTVFTDDLEYLFEPSSDSESSDVSTDYENGDSADDSSDFYP